MLLNSLVQSELTELQQEQLQKLTVLFVQQDLSVIKKELAFYHKVLAPLVTYVLPLLKEIGFKPYVLPGLTLKSLEQYQVEMVFVKLVMQAIIVLKVLLSLFLVLQELITA